MSHQEVTYCPTCSDTCIDHPTICTICGDNLVPQPPQSHQSTQNSSTSRHVSFHNNANGIRVAAGSADGTGDWETPAAEAMDPQQARSKTNPTSVECLKRIPRITIDPHSAILHEASIELSREGRVIYTFDATIGEFAPHAPYSLNGNLLLCRPIHGSLPLSMSLSTSSSSSSSILYMERGGNTTFVQKAQNAKTIGAQAVICGNHVPIWPYIMKDSSNSASPEDIPIVMVKRSDGKIIKSLLLNTSNNDTDTDTDDNAEIKVQIEAKKSANSCIICTEGFQIGSVVMRLPLCSHVFHEECALSWLTKHNTCPYCRRELPAEDDVYESERRRVGRSYAGAGAGGEEGGGLAEDQWETFFG